MAKIEKELWNNKKGSSWLGIIIVLIILFFIFATIKGWVDTSSIESFKDSIITMIRGAIS